MPSIEIMKGAASRNLVRAADFGRKAEERAAADVATSVATAAKGLAIGSCAERAPFLRVLLGKERPLFLRVFLKFDMLLVS